MITNSPRTGVKTPPMTDTDFSAAANPPRHGDPSAAPGAPHDGDAEAQRLRRMNLIRRLPNRLAQWVHWLLKPESRWARIPAGLLLILGGCLSILPVLGLWMLPLGVILIAEDAPPVRRQVEKTFDWLEKRWPNWFSEPDGN